MLKSPTAPPSVQGRTSGAGSIPLSGPWPGTGPRRRTTFPPLPEARIALPYGQLGEWTRAMDWVLRDRARRPRRFRWFVANPEMRGLVNDPRYLPLVRQEGLEALLPL